MSDVFPEQSATQAQVPQQSLPAQQPSYGQPQRPSYGQPQQPPGVAFGEPAPAPYQESRGRSWLLAALAGVVAGALAALVYASVSYLIQREFLMLIIAIGMVIGVTVRMVSARPGAISGVLAAVIAVPATLAAAIMLVVFFAAGSIPDGLSVLGDVNYGTVVSGYFSDPLGYVWFAASVIFAFVSGMKSGDKR